MVLKQSLLSNIAPDNIVVTDKNIIIVHYSFWGRYTGYNLISKTEFTILPYSRVIGLLIDKGRMLTTVTIKIAGFGQSDYIKNTLGIDGLWHNDANILVSFVQEYKEDIKKEKIEEVTIDEARELVKTGTTKFVWLGRNRLSHHVTALLGAEKGKLIHVNPGNVNALGRTYIMALKDCVLVDHYGTISATFARFLKRTYGINSFVLKNGLKDVDTHHEQLSANAMLHYLEKDIDSADNWFAANAKSIGRFIEILFGAVWGVDALLKLNGYFIGSMPELIAASAAHQPLWMAPWFQFWAGITALNPPFFAISIITLELLLSIALMLGILRKFAYGGGFILSLVVWSIPAGLGGPYGPASTDIGTGIAYAMVFLLLAVIDAMYGTAPKTLDSFIEKRFHWWKEIAEIKH
ncbi:MAG: hypothetical protein KGH69_03585 [Candidatus Micrarchaeota archaeon]|nr:hypothetical protein [Candidatus Micrarchaeota archaeon]